MISGRIVLDPVAVDELGAVGAAPVGHHPQVLGGRRVRQPSAIRAE